MTTSPGSVARAQRAERLKDFRNDFYDCLGSWADALFELADAALCAPGPVCFGAGPVARPHVPAQPRQPLQGVVERRGRRRPGARTARALPTQRLAAHVRGGRLHLGALRRGD